MSHRLLVAAAIGAAVLLACGAGIAIYYRRSRQASEGDRVSRRLIITAAISLAVVLALGATALDYRLNRPDAIEADRAAIERRVDDPAVLPSGYHERVVAKGLTAPTDFGFLPDGRILVAEKAGILRLVDPKTGASSVALDLRDSVDDSVFRGLLTVAVDPAFAENRFIYVVYTPNPQEAGSGERPTVERVSRFVLGDDGKAAAEKVLVGTVNARSCTDLPPSADCLPSDRDHDGAQLAFAADGTIFLSTGDGGGYDDEVEPTALRAQDPSSLAGKVLHITREGQGLADNPFAGSDLGANRAKVWAVGLRNPFRLALDRSGLLIAADVGADYADEVDAVPSGANLGWPCWEADKRRAIYASTPLCKALYASPPASLLLPLAIFRHPDAESITGGDFGPAAFPAATRGAYFVADWGKGWLRTIRIAPDGTAGAPKPFATSLPGPTAIHAGPNGGLYYVGLNAGEIREISASS